MESIDEFTTVPNNTSSDVIECSDSSLNFMDTSEVELINSTTLDQSESIKDCEENGIIQPQNSNVQILTNITISPLKLDSDELVNIPETSTVETIVNKEPKELCEGPDNKNRDEDMVIEDDGAKSKTELCLFQNKTMIELSRHSWTNEQNTQFYTRNSLWSPDGTCALMAVNMDGMHVFELPSDLYKTNRVSEERPLDVLQSVIHVKETGTVYDYCWYPFMDSNAPETCCWLATRQHEPIHMWDAFNGELRCTYRGYDAVDEVESAISVMFSNDGSKVLGGYKKSIKIFNTDVPGRDYTQINIKRACSCFASHLSHGDLIATGSWKCSIDIYDLRSPTLECLITLNEHTGGITHLEFSKDGNSLFSGARKDNKLIEWDMRSFKEPVRILTRKVETNQKIYFDFSPSGQWLVSGDVTGLVHVWDTFNNFKENIYPLHQDSCNGVNIHPSKPILATTCGQYHLLTEEDTNDQVKMYENSFVLWWCGDIDLENT